MLESLTLRNAELSALRDQLANIGSSWRRRIATWSTKPIRCTTTKQMIALYPDLDIVLRDWVSAFGGLEKMVGSYDWDCIPSILSVEVPVNPLKFDYYQYPYDASGTDECFLTNTNLLYKHGTTNIVKNVDTAEVTASAEDCKVKCQNHWECTHWVLYNGNSHCYLRNGPGIIVTGSSVSGSKRCPTFKHSPQGTGNVQDLLSR